MRIASRDGVETLSRGDGVVSAILHSDGGAPATDLTITWVEVDPGAAQEIHSHDPEQVYVLVEGDGEMTVGDETASISAGDLVHIPSNAAHGIENTGDEPLEYVSAATPAFPGRDIESFYDA